LKAGLWFRRGRLVMVSPVHGFMPQSGRKYTYPSCSDSPSQVWLCFHGHDGRIFCACLGSVVPLAGVGDQRFAGQISQVA
jgi:hypothetical protein